MRSRLRPHPLAAASVSDFYHNVEGMCLDRLGEALDGKTGLFSRQLRNRRWEPTSGAEEVTGTAICLIGLARAGIEPKVIGLDVSRTLEALIEAVRRHGCFGGAGLVVWANAAVDVFPVAELLPRLDIPAGEPGDLLERLTTMEAAWLVCGLAHEAARPGADGYRRLLTATSGLLSRFDGEARLFHHSSLKAALRHRFRRNLPNFADQIYPVQALAHAASALGMPEAMETAASCASRLIELQGDLGQWWWHYDSERGDVAQPYPVYSVHQHAMAPMALTSLTAAGGDDYAVAIEQSLAWLGENELGADLVDREAGTIWRSIERREGSTRRLGRNVGLLLGAGKGTGREVPAASLTVNYETRPYEWAWCLYAGAAARDLASGKAV